MSVAIRDRLAERFDPAWATMAAIAESFALVRASGLRLRSGRRSSAKWWGSWKRV